MEKHKNIHACTSSKEGINGKALHICTFPVFSILVNTPESYIQMVPFIRSILFSTLFIKFSLNNPSDESKFNNRNNVLW
jgi:hypothetical protein